MPTFSAPDGTTSRWRNSIWACLWQDLWTGVGWWWADLFFQSLQQHSFAMTKTACVERSTICHLDQLSYSYRCWERWGWPWMPEWAVFPTNTQGLSLSVIVGDCRGGREVEQGEKKKHWMDSPASWVTAHVESEFAMINRGMLPFSLSVPVHRPLRSQRLCFELWVYSIFSCPLSTVQNTDLSGR